MKRHALATAVVFLFASAALAQIPANFERGFVPEKLYHFNDVDHVNMFNGNLVLTIPIGTSYPLGGGSSYSLTLTYNSSVWEFLEVTPNLPGNQSCCQPWAYPTHRSNAGLGWTLSMGRFFDQFDSETSSTKPVYESPDGSDHEIEGVVRSVDGSYLRGHPVDQSIDFPDGSTATFYRSTGLKPVNGYGWLQRKTDAFGNYVDVAQEFNAAGGMLSAWHITDSAGRSHYVYFKPFAGTTTGSGVTAQTNYKTVVDRVVLEVPGGTATYQFGYADDDGTADAPTLVRESCYGYAQGWPSQYQLPVLRSVALPDGSAFRMATYITNSQNCGQGQITSMVLPTLGTIEWSYGSYNFPQENCNDDNWMHGVSGVTSRTFRYPGDVPAAQTWHYDQGLLTRNEYTVQCPVDNTPGGGTRTAHVSTEAINSLTTPSGNRDDYHFNVSPGSGSGTASDPLLSKPEYGAPQVRHFPDSTNSRYLSVESFDCSSGSCPPTPTRKKYIRYVTDGTTQDSSHGIVSVIDGHNPRVESERMIYEDGTVADVDRSGFDGFGHYRTTTTGGTFGSGNVRTSTTNYNPGTDAAGKRNGVFAFADSDPWVLGTYDSTVVSEGSHSAKSEACFEANGFLKGVRTLKNDGAQDSRDLLAAYAHDTHGNVTKESYYGGDYQLLNTGSLCSLALPAAPEYSMQHTYAFGVRSSSRYLGLPAPGFLTLDLTVDRSGAVMKSRDPSGIETSYAYWPWGALKTIAPRDTAATSFTYAPAALDGFNRWVPARVTMTRGSTQSDYQFDPFGRLWREKKLMPDGTTSVRETRIDAEGRQTAVSELEKLVVPMDTPGAPPHTDLDFTPSHWTSFAYDGFARPLQVDAPDGSRTVFSYGGVETVTRTVSVAAGETESAVSTVETYDRQGRLHSVTEAANSDPVTTAYAYDVGNRLVSVAMPGDGLMQQRAFTYDNRGFLLSETQPELGANGNGTTSYRSAADQPSFYDSRGHPHRRITGAANGPFDTSYEYDPAERLTVVTRSGTGALLKQFFYDDPAGLFPQCDLGRCRGKLAAAARWNDLGDLGVLPVSESYQYYGADGQISRRDVTIGTTAAFTGESFFHSTSYDSLGNVAAIGYPCRKDAFGNCLSSERNRSVSNVWSRGALAGVTGYASSITYQPNGLLDTVIHGSGATSVKESWIADTSGMSRPCSIVAYAGSLTLAADPGDPCGKSVSGGTAQWTSGAYQYDGAGNIKAMGAASYTYDAFNRLVSWTATSAAGLLNSQSVTYDSFGNHRVRSSRVCGPAGPCSLSSSQPMLMIGTTNHYAGMTYDAAGNLTGDGASQYSYDALNSMTSAQVAGRPFRYLYGPDDERIAAVERKTGADAQLHNRTTFTLRGFDNHLLSTWVDDWTSGARVMSWSEDEIFRGASLLANESPTGTRHYILDHLGSPRLVTNAAGQTVGTQDFSPWGAGGTSNGGPLQFTGHERDSALLGGPGGMPDYMHARYYSPTFGRFLSVDPEMESAYAELPQGWNRYVYVMNNQLKYIDLTGREITCVTVKDDKGNDKQMCSESVDVQGNEPRVSEVTPPPNMQPTDLSGLLRKRDERERVRNEREEQRVSNCYDQNRFSSLFGNGAARDVVGFIEVGSEISLAGDMVATGYKATQVSLGDQAYGSAMNWTFRRIGNAAGNPALKKSLTKFGDKATPALAVFGAFTAGYNASIYVQCRQGLL
jgi:RHS repeat-associated protein